MMIFFLTLGCVFSCNAFYVGEMGTTIRANKADFIIRVG